MYENSAVVIGNGESRKIINIQNLTGKITLVGCNAIHRDAIVDHLVCVDERMVKESLENVNTCATYIYTREHSYNWHRKVLKNKNLRQLPSIPNQTKEKVDQPRNWGSGTFALLIASNIPGIKKIFILGFDLYGNGQFVNNIYKNTKNYAKGGSHALDPSFWIYQSKKIFQHFSHIEYVIVNKKDWKKPIPWMLRNVYLEELNFFKKRFEI